MPSIRSTTDGLFFIADDSDFKCIIDYTDYFGNLGAIPMHNTYGEESSTIHDIILKDATATYNELATELDEPLDILSALISIAYLFCQSFQGFRPLNILETGHSQGLLTTLLIQFARVAHPLSHVWVLSEELHTDTFFRIAQNLGEESLENLSLLTTSPKSDIIRSNYFDLVILNGEQIIEDHDEVVRNMIRIVRPGGNILCHTQGDMLLRQCIIALPGEYVEYEISHINTVLVKKVTTTVNAEVSELQMRMRELGVELWQCLSASENYSYEMISESVSLLSKMERLSILAHSALDRDIMIGINSAKESALNCLYTIEHSFQKQCLEKLLDFAKSYERFALLDTE